MLRFLLACCLSLVAFDALAVTVRWNCAFTLQNGPQPNGMAQYTAAQAAQLANGVTCVETSKSTATNKIWKGTGPCNCVFTVVANEVASGVWSWGVSIADERECAVAQSGAVNNSSSSAGGLVRGSTGWTKAWFGCSDGTFTVGP